MSAPGRGHCNAQHAFAEWSGGGLCRNVFLATAKGPEWLCQQLVPGELMGTS